MNTCTVPECVKPARSTKADLCPMHYHRKYRHGDVARVATGSGLSVSLGRRYKLKYKPNHPLAGKNGNVYEHRMVLFDAIGYGPHPCHWCARPVDWAAKGSPNELQPDHLDGMGDNNSIENLAPSCRGCNTGRAVQARSAALREAGWWSGNDTIAHLKGTTRRDQIEPSTA